MTGNVTLFIVTTHVIVNKLSGSGRYGYYALHQIVVRQF